MYGELLIARRWTIIWEDRFGVITIGSDAKHNIYLQLATCIPLEKYTLAAFTVVVEDGESECFYYNARENELDHDRYKQYFI